MIVVVSFLLDAGPVIGGIAAGDGLGLVVNALLVDSSLAVEMTYKQFKAEYIDGTYTTISSSDNGEWLKTIDNNGDSRAD